MRNLKKLASVVLAAVMTLALAVPAFAAAPTSSITITNPVAGETYEFYKIFDAESPSAGNYTYKVSDAWKNFFGANGAGKDYLVAVAGATEGQKTENQATMDGVPYYIQLENEADAAAFATAALQYAVSLDNADKSVKAIAEGDGANIEEDNLTVNLSNEGLGYYLVYLVGASQEINSNASICSLTVSAPNADVTIKAVKPTIEKKTGENYSLSADSAQIGDVVPFQITGKVPNTEGFESYKYEINDTMSDGLTFNTTAEGENKLTVKINDVDLAADYYILTSSERGFTLTINVKKYVDNQKAADPSVNAVGQTIAVTYTAIVNENATETVNPETNTATLTYTDPKAQDGESTTPAEKTEVDIYVSTIVIDKYALNVENPSDTSTKLGGAKFVLKNGNGTDAKYYYWNNTDKKVEWVDTVAEATEVTTSSDEATKGQAKFTGLADGTYYLEETEAPEGYNKLSAPIEVKVQAEDSMWYGTKTTTEGETTKIETVVLTAQQWNEIEDTTEANQYEGGLENRVNYNQGVANSTGAELPETGGMGTTLFYAVGGLLVVGAGVLLVVKKRMGAE